MEDFKTWYEKKHRVPYPARCDERTHLVFQRIADSFAEWSREWMVEMANLMQPPLMIVPTDFPDVSKLNPGRIFTQNELKTAHQIMQGGAELQLDAALEDAAEHGAGFLRIKPDGSAERIAPEDWRADTKDRRLTQTAFNCGCCFKTQWFAGAGDDYEKAEERAKLVGWIFADGWGWFCCETCRAWEVDDA